MVKFNYKSRFCLILNRQYSSDSSIKFIQGTLYDGPTPNTSLNISKLRSDNIPLEVKENPPILGKDWPYISVHLIDSEGNVDKVLPKLGGIYAYQLIEDPSKLYVGISTNLSKRHLTHVKNTYYGTKSSPVFYTAVEKYGWSSFRLLILETIKKVDSEEIIASIYNREQFYFDLLRPCYNVNLIAAPGNQGYLWTEDQTLDQSIRQRGVARPQPGKLGSSYQLSEETKNKMKLRAGGVIVEVYENNTLVNKFNTLKEAGEYYNVSYSTIQRYADQERLWDNKYLFKLIPKVSRDKVNSKASKEVKLLPLDPTITKSTRTRGTVVDILNKDYNLVYKFNTVNDACLYLNTNKPTLIKFANSGKLWLNKWYVKYH